MLLAIDTATRQIGLALHDGQRLIAELTWESDNNHTVQLAPAVSGLLETQAVDVRELSGLAVCAGPGSYTGLRIGVAFAKGVAGARDLPLVGMSTLDILAAGQPYAQSGHGLITVVQAGRGRIIVQTHKWRKGGWASRAEPQLMTWEALINSVDGPATVTGDIDAAGFEALRAATARETPAPISIAPAAYRLRRAGFLAEYAWEQLRAAGDDPARYAPARLTPVYVKTEDAS
jgi:tRNA threonylcarbamoyladenosine biosynthesis protein TsaB